MQPYLEIPGIGTFCMQSLRSATDLWSLPICLTIWLIFQILYRRGPFSKCRFFPLPAVNALNKRHHSNTDAGKHRIPTLYVYDGTSLLVFCANWHSQRWRWKLTWWEIHHRPTSIRGPTQPCRLLNPQYWWWCPICHQGATGKPVQGFGSGCPALSMQPLRAYSELHKACGMNVPWALV